MKITLQLTKAEKVADGYLKINMEYIHKTDGADKVSWKKALMRMEFEVSRNILRSFRVGL